jgi:hypothetical protein
MTEQNETKEQIINLLTNLVEKQEGIITSTLKIIEESQQRDKLIKEKTILQQKETLIEENRKNESLSLKINVDKQTLNNLKEQLELFILNLDLEIDSQVNDKGEKIFSNENKRKAEKLRRLTNDTGYNELKKSIKDLEFSIANNETHLYHDKIELEIKRK